MNKTGGVKDKESTSRAQDAVLEAEARARALVDLHQRDFDTQLDQLSEDQVIERQMHELKMKKGPLRELPLLQEGNPNPSPLLPSQPQAGSPMKKQVERKPVENKTASSSSTRKELDLAELKKLLD